MYNVNVYVLELFCSALSSLSFDVSNVCKLVTCFVHYVALYSYFFPSLMSSVCGLRSN